MLFFVEITSSPAPSRNPVTCKFTLWAARSSRIYMSTGSELEQGQGLRLSRWNDTAGSSVVSPSHAPCIRIPCITMLAMQTHVRRPNANFNGRTHARTHEGDQMWCASLTPMRSDNHGSRYRLLDQQHFQNLRSHETCLHFRPQLPLPPALSVVFCGGTGVETRISITTRLARYARPS